jgi:hypothetical protein
LVRRMLLSFTSFHRLLSLSIDEKIGEAADAFASLERSQTQKVRALSAAAHLNALEEVQSSHWSDPYAASSLLRSSFRKNKKVRLESEGRAEAVRDKYGLGDRVTKEDLRTPAREVKLVEDREWEDARREKDRRKSVEDGARKRKRDQVGWGEETDTPEDRRVDRTAKPSSATSASSFRPGTSYRNEASARSRIDASSSRPTSSSSRPTRPLPSRSTSTANPSPALKSLTSKLLLATALKTDPFRTGASSPNASGTTLEGRVKVVRRTEGRAR